MSTTGPTTTVNLAPTAVRLNMTRPLTEDLPVNTVVGRLEADDPNGVVGMTFAIIAGNSLGHFQVVGDELRTAALLNYEDISTYSLVLLARDAGGANVSATVELRVLDVNDRPSVSVARAPALRGEDVVREGFLPGLTLYTIQVDDEDWNQTYTLSLSGAHASWFALASDTLTLAQVIGKDAPAKLEVTIIATDNGKPAMSGTLSLTLATASNSAPTAVRLIMVKTLEENMPANTTVGRVEGDDPDGTDDLSFAIVGGNELGHFALRGQLLQTTRPLDFEAVSSYSLTLRATDSSGASITSVATLRVTNVNDAPTVVLTPALVLAGGVVERGFQAGVGLYDITIVDDDWNQQHTVTISGRDASYFTYAFNQLTLAKAVGRDAPNSLQVTITARDNGIPVMTGQITVTITVKNPPSSCAKPPCEGAAAASSSSAGPDTTLVVAIAVIVVVLIIAALFVARQQRKKQQRAELATVDALKRDMRSPFGFQNARWYDTSVPDASKADMGAPLMLMSGRTAPGVTQGATAIGGTADDSDVAAESEKEAAAARAAALAAVEEEGEAGAKPTGTRLGRKVTSWFKPSGRGGADSEGPAAPETVAPLASASQRSSFSRVAETGFGSPSGALDSEAIRPRRRSTVWEMMGGEAATAAGSGSTTTAVTLGGDGISAVGEDDEDVFDLDAGSADFGDEDDVLDLDSLADAS